MSKFRNIGSIGDVNPIDYGGGFILRFPKDPVLTLVYIEPPDDDTDLESPEARWTIYTVLLESPGDWCNWEDVAHTTSGDAATYRASFADGADPRHTAMAIEDAARFYGWENFDSYPSQLTKGEVNKRFGRMKTR